MIIPNVFLTVTSNAGISIAQVGSLAIGTSNNIEDLLGSSITALKDIIGSEASQTEARVMSGTTDHSAFGTITLKIDSESTLSVTYVITVPPGEELPYDLIPFVDEFARAFGYQLLQISLLKRYLSAGKQLPHDAIAWAFLNAAIVANLSSEPPQIAEKISTNIKRLVNKLLSNYQDLAPLKHLEDENYLLSHTEYWKDEFLKPSFSYGLKQQLIDEALWKLVMEYTLDILLYPSPKEIPKILKKGLSDFLKKKIPRPEQEIIAFLKETISEETSTIHSELDLSYSHAVHRVIRERAIRKAIVKAIAKNPLIALTNIKRSEIRDKFEEIYTKYKYFSVEDILIEAVKPLLNERNSIPVEVFISTFFDTLKEHPLTEAGWAAINSFLLSMSGKTEQIIENAKKIANQIDKPKWGEQIEQSLRLGASEALPLTQVQEAQIIWKSIANASMESLATLIKEEYFGDLPNKLGRIPKDITISYYQNAKYILVSTMIKEIITTLNELNFSIPLSLPAATFLISIRYLNQGSLKYKTQKIKYKKKFLFFKDPWRIIVGGNVLNLWELEKPEFRENLFAIISNNQVTPITELVKNPQELYTILPDIELLIFAIQNIMMASIRSKVIIPIINLLEKNPVLLINENLINSINLEREERSREPLKTFLEELNKKSRAIQKQISKTINKSSTLSAQKKADLKAKIEKELNEILQITIQKLGKKLRKHSTRLKRIFNYKSYSHVLKYRDIYSETLLLNEKELAGLIYNKLKEKYGVYLSANLIPFLKASFANYLFDPVPESVVNEAITFLSKNKNKKNLYFSSKNIDDLLVEHHLTVPDLLNSIKLIISSIEKELVNNDAPIAVEKSSVFVELFSIRSRVVPSIQVFSKILPYEKVDVDLVAGRWIGKIKLLDLEQFRSEIPLLVTFSDVIRYGVLQETRNSINLVYSGIGLVIKYLNRESPNLLNQLKDSLEESLFKA